MRGRVIGEDGGGAEPASASRTLLVDLSRGAHYYAAHTPRHEMAARRATFEGSAPSTTP